MEVSKVSVVMCTYNGAAYLRQQLDTVLAQTFPLFELLIFDDASTDDTFHILQEYASRFPVIQLYRNSKNIGYAANFKQALLAAKGDVIAISDQDDIWVADKLEKMSAAWDQQTPIIYCNSIRFTGTIPENPVADAGYRRFEGTDARKIFLFNTVSGHAMLIQRDFLQLAFPFSDVLFYDWWFAVVAACNGGVSYLDEVLVFQRVHAGNISVGDGLDHTQKEQRNGYKQLVIKHLKEFIHAPGMTTKDKLFAKKFAALLEASLHTTLHLPLLLFMVRHRNPLFYHKKKSVALFSYLKYAYRLTFNYGKS